MNDELEIIPKMQEAPVKGTAKQPKNKSVKSQEINVAEVTRETSSAVQENIPTEDGSQSILTPATAIPVTPEKPKRSKNMTLINSLKSMGVLTAILVVGVMLLAGMNALMPKYVPKLDEETVAILNGMVSTGVSDAVALEESYFVFGMEHNAVEAWNGKSNTSATNKVLAVYKMAKAEGDNAANIGTVFVETISMGYEDVGITLITAISPDGKILGLYVRKISAAEYYKPAGLAAINQAIIGKDVNSIAANDFSNLINAGATAPYTTNGFVDGIRLAARIFAEVPDNV